MAVALNHLGCNRRRLQAETAADVGLDRGRQVRKRADGARELADRYGLARAAHTGDVPRELREPERQLQAERHRLGMHAVRAADHRRPPMLVGALPDGLHQAVEPGQDQVAGVAHLQRLGGVDDVGGGEAEVEPPRRGADVLGHGGGEGDDVVLRDLFDFFDPLDVEPAAFPDVARRVRRDDAGARHRVRRSRFHLQPGFVLPLVAPDATHFGACVASDHRCGIYPSASLSGGSCRPLTAPSTVAASAPFANRSRATRCTSPQLTRSTPSSVSSSPNWRSK